MGGGSSSGDERQAGAERERGSTSDCAPPPPTGPARGRRACRAPKSASFTTGMLSPRVATRIFSGLRSLREHRVAKTQCERPRGARMWLDESGTMWHDVARWHDGGWAQQQQLWIFQGAWACQALAVLARRLLDSPEHTRTAFALVAKAQWPSPGRCVLMLTGARSSSREGRRARSRAAAAHPRPCPRYTRRVPSATAQAHSR